MHIKFMQSGKKENTINRRKWIVLPGETYGFRHDFNQSWCNHKLQKKNRMHLCIPWYECSLYVSEWNFYRFFGNSVEHSLAGSYSSCIIYHENK